MADGDETVVRCTEHGTIVSDERCQPCHDAHQHDPACRYLGNDAWDCGVVDGEPSTWTE